MLNKTKDLGYSTMSSSTILSAKRRRTCTHHIKGTTMKTLRKKRTSTRTTAMIAGSLLAVSLVGSTPAYAGPVAAAAMLAATTNACSVSWVFGPWALLCYAGAGAATVGTLFIPSP